MERIRLNVITLKTQMQKVKLQLKHGNKLSNSLRVIDFEELKIENEECIRKIDEKNQYLLGMKRIAGKEWIEFRDLGILIIAFDAGHYSIALTKHKGKLSNLMSNMNEITNRIVSKDQEITKLKLSQSVMKDEIKKMEKQIESITELMENFRVMFLNFLMHLLYYNRILSHFPKYFFNKNFFISFSYERPLSKKSVKLKKTPKNIYIHIIFYCLMWFIQKMS